MTLFARRLYYSLACLAFFVTAPLVLLPAAGYQWQGWRLGWRGTGVLVVSTTPKTALSINGKYYGQATKFTVRLVPGQYQVALERSGYTNWQRLIRIDSNVANVIGPVMLFPTTLKSAERGGPFSHILIDQAQNAVFSGTLTGQTRQVQQVWPKLSTWKITVPTEPTSVWLSPKQRLVVIGTPAQTIVTTIGPPLTSWSLAPLDHLFWGERGDAVFYGLRGGQLFVIDALAQTETVIGQRTSAGWYNHQLWSTSGAGQTTRIFYQTSETIQPVISQDLPGNWQIEPSPAGTLLMRDRDSRQVQIFMPSSVRAQTKPLALGPVDRLWWPDRQLPPLWQDGRQVYTLDTKNQPLLLERGPTSYQEVLWLAPRHILVSNDGQQLVISSVSPRQGQGIILTHDLSSPAHLINVDRGRKTILLQSLQPPALFTLSW